MKLTQGFPFYTPIEFTASSISYTCTPQANFDLETSKGWSTIVLPFAASSCQAAINGAITPLNWRTATTSGDIVIATYKSENNGTMEFGLPESTLEACHPYLLGIPATINRSTSLDGAHVTFSASNAQVATSKAVITGRDHKMVGTFTAISDKDNILVLNSEGSAFVPGTAVSPFMTYFMPIGSAAPATTLHINVDYGLSTSISEIITSHPSGLQGPIYNLNGQRVTRPGKGIYIVGGKKVIF